MSQYSTGTATVTNGSATVTGSGTLWLANVSAADSFTIAGDGVMYDVASVDSDTQVTLSAPYAGTTASGAVYAIGTGFTVPDNFPEMSQGDIETATIFTRAMRKIQSRFTAIVSDISGKADQATTYTETEVDSLLDDKAAIAGQTFTGDIAAPKITASTGILFGTDTAAANTLDDYERGNWTPVIDGGTKAYTTLASASYVKIGNLVYVQCFINGLSGGDGTPFEISGLPFGVATDGFSTGSIDYGSGTVLTNPHVRSQKGTDVVKLRKEVNDVIIQTDIGGFLIFSITYEAG